MFTFSNYMLLWFACDSKVFILQFAVLYAGKEILVTHVNTWFDDECVNLKSLLIRYKCAYPFASNTNPPLFHTLCH